MTCQERVPVSCHYACFGIRVHYYCRHELPRKHSDFNHKDVPVRVGKCTGGCGPFS